MAVDHGTLTERQCREGATLDAVNFTIRQYIREVKAQIPIDKVYVYGSYASGTAKWDSDVDLCFFSSAFSSGEIFDALEKLWRLK
jgi:predicted nucleotidyltransferase